MDATLLLLLVGLPPQPSSLRVRVWRRMRSLGAVPLKRSAYLLPDTPERYEDFQWLAQEIQREGGDATLVRVHQIENMSEQDVLRPFHEPRDQDYRHLAARYRKVLQSLERKGAATSARVQDELARLAKDHQRIRDIDFFDAAGGAEVRRLEEAITMRTRRPESVRREERPALDVSQLRGRRWVTRPRPHIDRIALRDCIDAVEQVFRLHAEGRTLRPGVLAVPGTDVGFHIKAAGLGGERPYFAAKTNANFPDNPRRFGLPAIQGTVVLADARNGEALAVMDSGSVTALRTGAATAVAAKFLARRDTRAATIVGAGVQGEMQLAALAAVLPLERAWLFDLDHARAETVAARAGSNLGLTVAAGSDLRAALAESDVCVTCTPARRPFVAAADVKAGTFIAAVGADAEGKQELDPAL